MAELTTTPTPPESTLSNQAGSNSRKSELAEGSAGISSQIPTCPHCGSRKLWHDGLRYSPFGEKIQRWLCRDCGLRFSDPKDVQSALNTLKRVERIETKSVNTPADRNATRQICVKETKNLATEHQKTDVLRTNEIGNIGRVKGKIDEFEKWMQNQGFRESTVAGRKKLLKIIVKRGAELYDPETVKDVISKQKGWCEGRKANAVDAYSSFLSMVGGTWKAPVYTPNRKIPFVPKETEIDQLITACSNRVATFLQLLKETGARGGEAWILEHDQIDYETNTVRITPEKNSNPRIFHISHKLTGMLQNLPKDYGKFVFSLSGMPLDHFRDNFTQQRTRIASNKNIPRLQQITFKTLRTWKGTMEYHRTKDVLYVMSVLGHKNIKNTLVYIQLEEALFKDQTDYISKVAKTENEALVLIEAGFEFVLDFDGHKLFRKRKT